MDESIGDKISLKGKASYTKRIIIILGLVLVAVFLLAIINLAHLPEIEKNIATSTSSLVDKPIDQTKVIGDGRHSLGATKPIITVVEFGDFGCSMCQASYPKIRRVVLKNKDKIRLIYRDFIHPAYPDYNSRLNLALAAECAQEQGKFWEMHDKIFDNKEALMQDDVEKKEGILATASALRLSMPRFQACLKEQRYIDQIRKDYYDGANQNIEGTPTWFINGYKVAGDIQENALEAFFDKIINQK